MISIIIVNYNSDNYLTRCIESINNSDIKSINIEIIIVNNNSFKTILNQKYKNLTLKIIENTKNLGYSKAVNIGVYESNFPIIITMNPDVVVENDTIANMYNYFNNHNSIGVLGCKVLNPDKSFQLSSRRRFPTLDLMLPYLFKLHSWGFRNRYNYMDISANKAHGVDSVSGAFMMFYRHIYTLVDGFDERFFLYFEDTDFCYKVIKKGYDVFYYPDSKIMHVKNGSRNYFNYLFIKLNLYLSFFKFIYKYKLLIRN